MSYDTNLRNAVAALIKAKGRYHSAQTYQALVAAFDAPDESTIKENLIVADSIGPIDERGLVYIVKPDPRYDARCALQDRTDWSAA